MGGTSLSTLRSTLPFLPVAGALFCIQLDFFSLSLALLGIGVLGVLAPSFDRGFQLAAVITFSVFYLGAAIGHPGDGRRGQHLAGQRRVHLLVRHRGCSP